MTRKRVALVARGGVFLVKSVISSEGGVVRYW